VSSNERARARRDNTAQTPSRMVEESAHSETSKLGCACVSEGGRLALAPMFYLEEGKRTSETSVESSRTILILEGAPSRWTRVPMPL